MVKHCDRPTKLWEWDVDNKVWCPDEDGYLDDIWECEAVRVAALRGLKRWQRSHGEVPAVCKECAVRLGLEW